MNVLYCEQILCNSRETESVQIYYNIKTVGGKKYEAKK